MYFLCTTQLIFKWNKEQKTEEKNQSYKPKSTR